MRRRLKIAAALVLYLGACFVGTYAFTGSLSRAGWATLAAGPYLGGVAFLCGLVGMNELW